MSTSTPGRRRRDIDAADDEVDWSGRDVRCRLHRPRVRTLTALTDNRRGWLYGSVLHDLTLRQLRPVFLTVDRVQSEAMFRGIYARKA